METQNNTNKVGKCAHSFGWCLTSVVVVFLAGGVVCSYIDPQLPASISNSKKSYEKGFSAARKIVENSSMGPLFRSPEDVRSIAGTVTSVKGNSISIKLNSDNPFDDPALNNRTVIVSSSTKIVSLSVSTSTSKTSDVVTYIPTIVNVSNLKKDDYLLISASENIKNLKEFTARDIQIQPASTK